MTDEVAPLVPGQVGADHLDVLIENTRMPKSDTSKRTCEALHDYFVNAMPAAQAIEKAGFTKAHFYRAVRMIQEKHQYAAKASRFYEIRPVVGVKKRAGSTAGEAAESSQ